MDEIVYLNGTYLPVSEASISVTDRGFLFADGVYDLVSVRHGKPLFMEAHFARLRRSLREINLQCPLSDAELQNILITLQQRNIAAERQGFYIQVTRGSESLRHHHYRTPKPTVYARLETVTPRVLSGGVSVITGQDIRWQRCDIKSINRLANVLFAQQAKQAQAEEFIILQGDYVLEGSTSNVFIVKDGQIITSPLSDDILSGITRRAVMAVADQVAPCLSRPFYVSELYAADEVWLTSSSRDITPVISVDGQSIGSGKPGPIYHQVLAAYQQAC